MYSLYSRLHAANKQIIKIPISKIQSQGARLIFQELKFPFSTFDRFHIFAHGNNK